MGAIVDHMELQHILNAALDWKTVSIALLTLFATSSAVKLIRGLKAVNYLPGKRVPFQPFDVPGALLPTSWWNPSIFFTWKERFQLYKTYDNETFSVVPFAAGVPAVFTSNLDIARQVASGSHKTSFIKPESASRALLLWGMNLVASEGEVWRKHRRIVGPAFSNDLYHQVWLQTLATYREMIESEGWEKKEAIEVPSIQHYTFKTALMIIGKCGFGLPIEWAEPPTTSERFSVQEALRIVADTHLMVLFAPKWIMKLPFQKFKQARAAHEGLLDFMHAQVQERKAAIRGDVPGERRSLRGMNVFQMLVQANETDEDKLKLDDNELIGNVFILLFAGHETTAHSLAATLGFMAAHEDIQDEVLENILSVVGHDRDPAFEDYGRLNKVLGVFYEATRMFPAGFVLIREAAEDTVLNIPNPVGQEGSKVYPVPKGLQVVVDMIGVQYNPRYFDEPEKFKPSRWYDVPPDSEAFSAFSVGPRACIGRKFATTEAVCFLTSILRDFKVEPLLNPGETKEQWVARVLDASVVLTLGVKDVPVRFVRRRR